jgi:hypothetical protein
VAACRHHNRSLNQVTLLNINNNTRLIIQTQKHLYTWGPVTEQVPSLE